MCAAPSVSASPSAFVSTQIGASAASPGLVSSKTNGHEGIVSFGPSVVAERRVARLKKAVWASGHLHAMVDLDHGPSVCWFVTLTYVGVDDWKAQHISKACGYFRKWCRRQRAPCRYTWVAELQARGAVHYHLLAWLPSGVEMPHWDMARGARTWWPHGMSNTQRAKAGVGYLMKYLSKLGEFHRFPKGLRLYGVGGLSAQGRKVRTWLNLPEWVKREFGVGEVTRSGSGLTLLETGELLESPYRVQRIPSGLRISLKRPLAARFHDGAYCSWRPSAA